MSELIRSARAAAIAVLVLASSAAVAQETLMPDIHGFGYSADGSTLLVGTHHGVVAYSDGAWRRPAGAAAHDLMGFAPSAGHLYTSGHPAPGSGLKNPLGLMRSADGGMTWNSMGLLGEADFHLLGAGWSSGAVYVFNPSPNSRMRTPGLYSTVNDGFVWQRRVARGLAGAPTSIAPHPTEARTVAVGTQGGLYLSSDGGERFERLAEGQVLAAAFSPSDGSLWFSTFDGRARLERMARPGGAPEALAQPAMDRDAVAFIAHHPSDARQHAIATFERDVFVTADAGRTWTRIARRGAGQ